MAGDIVSETEKKTYPFDPDWTIAPGEILRDELLERAEGIHMDTWAKILHLTPDVLQGIFAGTTPITEDIAARIAHGLGTGAKVWLRLEEMYRAGLTAGKKDLTRRCDG